MTNKNTRKAKTGAAFLSFMQVAATELMQDLFALLLKQTALTEHCFGGFETV